MKYKVLLLSLFAFGAGMVANAQQANEEYIIPKWNDNIFVGIGGGIQSVDANGLSKISPDFSLEVGKYITPVWGVRAVGTAGWQTLHDGNVHIRNKKHIGLNLDMMLNLSTIFAGINPDRKFEVYGFLGPQMNIHKAHKAGTVTFDTTNGSEVNVEADPNSDRKVFSKVGASAGIGGKYNFNDKWSLFLESRATIAPSIFTYSSKYRKGEGVANFKLGVAYTIGGRKYKKPTNNIVEKEIVKEVIREVPKEVVVEKEVVKYVDKLLAVPAPIFFKMGKADLTEKSKVTIKLLADAIKKHPEDKFIVAAYCDEATGSPKSNKKLSEKRLKAVVDILLAEGVKEEQIIGEAHGGTKNMFGKDYLNRVVLMKSAK